MVRVAPLHLKVEVAKMAYPRQTRDVLCDRSVGLFLGAGGSANFPEEYERALVNGLAGLGALIIDARHFFRLRGQQDEQNALLSEIQALGFSEPVEVWHNEAADWLEMRLLYLEKRIN
jgi:hypothetical protein